MRLNKFAMQIGINKQPSVQWSAFVIFYNKIFILDAFQKKWKIDI